jgi:hypothetical protein
MGIVRSGSALTVILIVVCCVVVLGLAGYAVSCLLPASSPFALFCRVPEVVPLEPYIPPWDSDAQVVPLSATATVARVVGEWGMLQKLIPLTPTLGATAWRPTDIQLIGSDRLLVRFEDGHVSATAVVGYTGAGTPEYVALLQDEPWTDTRWKEVVAQYGDAAFQPRTFTTSIVRGESVLTFSGWTEVPENVFVR